MHKFQKLRFPYPWHAAALATVLACISQQANAQAQSIGAISSAANNGTDQSMAALKLMFGSVVSSPLSGSGGSSSPIATVLGVVNASILVIGGIYALYLFFSAMIATGAEGEFLGQKRSSIWFTIRNSVGFASIVPFTGGYCLAQLFALWSTMMGVGIANLGLSAAISVLASGGTLVATPPPPQVVTLSKALFEANLCAVAANSAASNVSSDTGGVAADSGEQFSPKSSNGSIVLVNGNGLSCGGAAITLNTPDDSTLSAAAAGPGLAYPTIDTSQITLSISQAQQSALSSMQSMLSSAARTYVSAVAAGSQPADPQATIENAASAYQSTVLSAASSASNSISSLTSSLQSSLQSSGWIMTGAWYQTFATANTQLASAVATTGGAVPGTDLSNLPYPALYNKVMEAYSQQLDLDASINNSNASGTTSSTNSNTTSLNTTSSSTVGSIISSIFSGQSWVHGAMSMLSKSNGTVNPLIGMKNFGDYIMGAGDAALATYAVISYGQGVKSGITGKIATAVADFFTGDAVSGLSRVVTNLSPLILMLIVSLYFYGVMLSVYLPMMPFMIWFSGVLSWFAVVCEGVVAAPLWGFAHLEGEGEGMGPKTAHGYVFMMNLMLRPVFMVIGFLLASVGVVAIGGLLNTMFAQAMANAQFSSMTGVVSIIAYVALYVGMCQTMCQALFGLVHHIPNAAISWLGSAMSNQFGHDTHDKGHQIIAGAVRTAGGNTERALAVGLPKKPAAPGGNSIEKDPTTPADPT